MFILSVIYAVANGDELGFILEQYLRKIPAIFQNPVGRCHREFRPLLSIFELSANEMDAFLQFLLFFIILPIIL